MAQFNTKTYANTFSLQVKGTNTDLAFLPVDLPASLPAVLNITSTVKTYPTFADISKVGFSTAQGDWNKFNFYSNTASNIGIRSSIHSLADSIKIATYDKLMSVRDARYPSWIPDGDALVTTGVLYVHSANYVPPTTSQHDFITPGAHTWVCPAGVTSICVVAVGSGGTGGYQWSSGGGGGGGLGWKNNISVTPGQSYTIQVGAPGPTLTTNATNADAMGNNSYFDSESVVCGFGAGRGGTSSTGTGNGGYGGGYTGDGGGRGGNGGYNGAWNLAGGGAGGYSGKGGDGGSNSSSGQAGQGGGGGAGGWYSSTWGTPGGGGVGLLGEGASGGNVSITGEGGKGGSGGADGHVGEPLSNNAISNGDITGGNYGGGGGGSGTSAGGGPGGQGAVRIIYGPGRAYPSTDTGGVSAGPVPTTGLYSSSLSERIGIANPTTVAPTDYFDISTTSLKVTKAITDLSYVSNNTLMSVFNNVSGNKEIIIDRSKTIKAVRNAGAFNPSYSKSKTIPINVTDLSATVGVFVKNGITTYETITNDNNPTILDVVYVDNGGGGGGGEGAAAGPVQFWT
jgi:hypothetical protein